MGAEGQSLEVVGVDRQVQVLVSVVIVCAEGVSSIL
jgi:hypothetical protein